MAHQFVVSQQVGVGSHHWHNPEFIRCNRTGSEQRPGDRNPERLRYQLN
ncbi:hypothetical protein GFS60_07338 (plasmid) [Rhodococcus sp. WAY2]|nr:hypothetical protein GFS60_07338 [Rhodococcus sp. WAY2]